MSISDIIVDAPLWQWFLGIAVALGLTLMRYPGIKWGLAIVRLLVLGSLCFLLLEPLIKLLSEEEDPATVVLLHDASMSQWMGVDSLERKGALTAWATEGQELFENEGFAVEVHDFGKKIQHRERRPSDSQTSENWNCNEERTDLGSALGSLNDLYSNKNISAVVVSTDGLSNRGRDPEFGISLLNAPHYFIGTGDTSQISDLSIADVYANEVTYLDNEFPVEVRLDAKGLSGQTPNLHIHLNGKKIETSRWSIEKNHDFAIFRYRLKADKPGVAKISISSPPLPGETISSNNYTTTYIEVLESKRKVLIAAAAPHPDVNALRSALESNLHQEVEVLWAYDFAETTTLPQHDILILHNLPSKKPAAKPATNQVIKSAISSNTPVAFFGGSQIDWSSIPLERKGFTLTSPATTQEVGATVVDGFSLYDRPSDRELLYLPPVISPIAEFTTNSSLNSLLNQRLGTLKTDWPLLSFNTDASGRRTASFLAEGIWRWKMELYLKEGNHAYFDDLVNNMVQYLSSRDDVKRFRVKAPKRLDSDERLRFSAQIYNASLQPTTDSDITLKLISLSAGLETEYSFSTENQGYTLDCGKLDAGEYSWTATTTLDSELKRAKGNIIIEEVKAEVSSTPANHALLSRLGNSSGGALIGSLGTTYSASEAQAWASTISTNVNKKPVVLEYTERLDLINLEYILYIILTLLSIEWIVRRRQGGY